MAGVGWSVLVFLVPGYPRVVGGFVVGSGMSVLRENRGGGCGGRHSHALVDVGRAGRKLVYLRGGHHWRWLGDDSGRHDGRHHHGSDRADPRPVPKHTGKTVQQQLRKV